MMAWRRRAVQSVFHEPTTAAQGLSRPSSDAAAQSQDTSTQDVDGSRP